MKYVFIGLMITAYSFAIKAQCSVNVGPDRVICTYNGINDTMQLHPLVSGTTGPLNYTWSFTYPYCCGITIDASAILDTVNIANPRIIRNGEISHTYGSQLSLTVVDSVGNVCADSMLLRFSAFGYLTVSCVDYISRGQSVDLNSNIVGGIAPLSYVWSPNYRISDSTSGSPTANPDTSINYYCRVTDSAGCLGGISVCNILVDTLNTGLSEINDIWAKIYPDPIDKTSVLSFDNPDHETYGIQVYGNVGNLIASTYTIDTVFPLGSVQLDAGLYYLTISNKNGRSASHKFVVY